MNNFLKKFDYFGVEIFFLYDSKIKYYSSTGGFIFLIFFFISLIYVGCNIKPFVTRKNMTLIFYDKKIEQTDIIDFENYTSRFSYQYVCSGFEQTELDKLFQITVHHVTMNSTNGEKKKTKVLLNSTKCKKNDFYNEFNATYDNNGYDKNLFCPDLKDFVIGGVYQDHIFKYFELTTSARKNADPDKIRAVLQNYECRLEVNHVDTVINVYDYSHPIKRYIRSEFSTIKANLLNKMNIYFKVQTFDSYENYLFDKHSNSYYLGYSYFEEYEDDKGYDRFIVKPYNYDTFAKIYLRADLERTIIQRKYMKLTEFAANMSSILSEILLILYVIVRFINRIYAEQSVIKKIFQFKDVYKNEKNETVIKKMKIKFGEPMSNNYFKKEDNSKKEDHDNSINKSSDEATISITKNIIIPQNEIPFGSNKNTSTKAILKINKPRDLHSIAKNNVKVNINIFEIILQYLLPCFTCKSLRIKQKLFTQGFHKLCFQLDVLTYLKKMQQIELMHFLILNPSQNNMVHFLSKPSISALNQKDIYDYLDLQYNVDIKDHEIDEFYTYLKNLSEKTERTEVEDRLLDVAVLQLKNLLSKQEE